MIPSPPDSTTCWGMDSSAVCTPKITGISRQKPMAMPHRASTGREVVPPYADEQDRLHRGDHPEEEQIGEVPAHGVVR